jgi:uncharacterized protein YbjT (DUF2867 family)
MPRAAANFLSESRIRSRDFVRMTAMQSAARSQRQVFVTGGTGYLGSSLCRALLERGHRVRALVRPGSERRLPHGVEPVVSDPFDARSFAAEIPPCDTFVQLVGVKKPAPWKEREFRAIDRASAFASIDAAKAAGIAHFVYVSVAQPAPVMKSYVRVRAECEARIREADLVATIVRPWYVLGRGHRWPIVLAPMYALLERVPSTRAAALRLGLVTHAQMIATLVRSIEDPPRATRVLETEAIRSGGTHPASERHPR